jgi:hypothetical protein
VSDGLTLAAYLAGTNIALAKTLVIIAHARHLLRLLAVNAPGALQDVDKINDLVQV